MTDQTERAKISNPLHGACFCPWCGKSLPLFVSDYEACPDCHGSFSFKKPLSPVQDGQPDSEGRRIDNSSDGPVTLDDIAGAVQRLSGCVGSKLDFENAPAEFTRDAWMLAEELIRSRPAQPGGGGCELPTGDGHWVRREGDWSIIVGELSHSCRNAFAGWSNGEVHIGLLHDLPHGGWHPAIPAPDLTALRQENASLKTELASFKQSGICDWCSSHPSEKYGEAMERMIEAAEQERDAAVAAREECCPLVHTCCGACGCAINEQTGKCNCTDNRSHPVASWERDRRSKYLAEIARLRKCETADIPTIEELEQQLTAAERELGRLRTAIPEQPGKAGD